MLKTWKYGIKDLKQSHGISKLLSFVTAFMMLTSYVPMVNFNTAKAEGDSSPQGYLSKIKDELGVDTIPDEWYITPNGDFYDIISQEYDDGYKTEDTALAISNESQLAAFAKFVNDGDADHDHTFKDKFVRLTDNINLGGSGILFTKSALTKDDHGNDCFAVTIEKNGEPKNLWKPIGNATATFQGTFDGQDYGVFGMLAVSEEDSIGMVMAGLFGVVGGVDEEWNRLNVGIIQNLCVSGDAYCCSAESSYSQTFAGGLAGYNLGTITDCYATGNAYAYSSESLASAGGLVGGNYGTITNCYATGGAFGFGNNNSFPNSAGGLVGRNDDTITNCYATGNAYTYSSERIAYAGGLVGYDYEGTITNCYTTGNAYAYSSSSEHIASAGGLVGYDYEGTIINCYRFSGSTVESKGKYEGRICDEGTAIDDINKFKGNVTVKLDNFVEFNQDNIWVFTNGEYPKLKSVETQSDQEPDSESTKTTTDVPEQTEEISKTSESDSKVTIYKDNVTKVQLEWAEGVFPENVRIEISEVSEGENYNTVLTQLDEKQKNIVEKIKFYDIKVIDEDTGETCQPNGKVTIRLPIPDDFDRDELEALRVTDEADVEFENEKAVFVDGTWYLEFETDHFSYYALMDLLSKDDVSHDDIANILSDETSGGSSNDGIYNPSTGDNIRLFMIILTTSILELAVIFVIKFNTYKKKD